MNKLLAAIAETRAKLQDSSAHDSRADKTLGDAAELLCVLERILRGMPAKKAFSAPGDWGYSHPIGRGVLAMLQGEDAKGGTIVRLYEQLNMFHGLAPEELEDTTKEKPMIGRRGGPVDKLRAAGIITLEKTDPCFACRGPMYKIVVTEVGRKFLREIRTRRAS